MGDRMKPILERKIRRCLPTLIQSTLVRDFIDRMNMGITVFRHIVIDGLGTIPELRLTIVIPITVGKNQLRKK